MPAVALLVFREVLEAALIISIICAATRDVPGRAARVLGGIGLGVAGALLVALGADFIANLASGAGPDIFNAAVLLFAVLMIGWHVIWMSSHGRELAQQMTSVGCAVKQGSRSLNLLLTVVALAVLREGSEVVLFLFGLSASGINAVQMTGGVALGIIGGAALGFALYIGLLRVPINYFFTVTNIMLVLLAAGLASTAAGYLVQSDLLPAMGSQIWDTTRLLSDDSAAGKMLGVLIGYKSAPAGIQLAFYLTIVALLTAGMRWQQKRVTPRSRTASVPRDTAPRHQH